MEQEQLTLEQMKVIVENKSIELRNKLNKKVFPIMCLMDDEYIVGYLTEPTREQKAIALGKLTKTNSIFSAGMDLLTWNLIKEASDVRLFSDDSKYDGLIFAAAEEAMLTIEILTNEAKKK